MGSNKMYWRVTEYFLLLFSVTQLSHSLVCEECKFSQCSLPGGRAEKTCGSGEWFCEVEFLNGGSVTKGCADNSVKKIPLGYLPVNGNKLKQCKENLDGNGRHCYCKKNRCNAKEEDFSNNKEDLKYGSCSLISILIILYDFV